VQLVERALYHSVSNRQGHGAFVRGLSSVGGRACRVGSLTRRQTVVCRRFCVGVERRGDEHIQGYNRVPETP